MGASNVMAAYAYWSHLDHAPFRLLVYMALVSLDHPKDGQSARRYYAGQDALVSALGYPVPPDQNATRCVRRSLRKLTLAGAVETVVRPAPGRRPEYALRLDGGPSASGVAGDDRGLSTSSVGEANGGRSEPPTEDAQSPNRGRSASATEDAERPPQEPLRNQSGTQEEEGVASPTQVQTAREDTQPHEISGSGEGEATRSRAPECSECGIYLDPDGTCPNRACRRYAP